MWRIEEIAHTNYLAALELRFTTRPCAPFAAQVWCKLRKGITSGRLWVRVQTSPDSLPFSPNLPMPCVSARWDGGMMQLLCLKGSKHPKGQQDGHAGGRQQ